jgi:tetratricopeptide (TPR) repeat protein
VNPHLILILIALLYILMIGGLSALRREGLSLQFAVEVVVVAGLLMAFSLAMEQAIHPVLFLGIMYLVTMRVRLIIDLGNLLARRGHGGPAMRLYDLALKLRPDGVSRQIVQLNQAVHRLRAGQLAQAAAELEGLLAADPDSLNPKHEAAARYNLAVAYRRQGNEARAVVEFNKVIDLMPGSLYASGARSALEKGKRQNETDDHPDLTK